MDTSDGHLSPGRPNPDIGVYPYWELTFDADGHPEQAQLDGLVQGVGTAGTTDLVLFAHGWNNDLTAATRLYRRFFTPFPALLVSAGATAKVGYAGVYWPSMRFSDEPIPEFNPAVAPEAARMAAERGMDRQTLDGLVRQFPDGEPELRAMAELLRARPASRTDLDTFFRLVRSFAGTPDRSTLLDAGEPGEAAINEHLGDAYWTIGRVYEARYAWRAALLTADDKDKARLTAKIDTGLDKATAAP